MIHQEGATDVGQLYWVELALTKRTIPVHEEPGPNASRVVQVIDVAGQRADQVSLFETFHADGALRSAYVHYRAVLIYLPHARLRASVLPPIVRVALLEPVLHISVDFSTILAKYSFLKVLQDLLILLIDCVLRVTIEELLLVAPE